MTDLIAELCDRAGPCRDTKQSMNFAFTRAFLIRHRRSMADLSIIAFCIGVLSYLAMEFDFFVQEGHETLQQETIELDEAMLIGAVLALGLLIFAIRRYREQKQESARLLAAEQHIRVLAFQDPLTGLPNRRQFDDALKAAIAAPPREHAVHAVLLLDLNGFKRINDVYGHSTGDEVLRITSERLISAMHDGHLVARLGGDEFAVLATHLASPEAATSIALRIIDSLSKPILLGATPHQVGSGIGIALVPSDAITSEQALRKADLALYRAKEERPSALHFFEDDLDRRVREREWLEQELRVAVSTGKIQTVFEPTVDLRSGRITGFEVSPKWIHPVAGEIAPDRFIAIAEETGIIHQLMNTVLREACTVASRWPSNIVLSMDILPVQLKDESLKLRIMETLAQTGLAAERLEMEITESALVRDLEAAQFVLGGLRDLGVRIALDNFGTGYSSLYHLRNFKLDKIKIDSSFIRAMHSQKESADVIQALVGLAHGLGLSIAAEGVEDADQRNSLVRTGCQQGQGQLYSHVLSGEQTLTAVKAYLEPSASGS